MASHLILRPLRGTAQRLLQQLSSAISTPTRNYISEMRKEAFEGNMLRLLRNEVEYEIERSPISKSVPEFESFMIDKRAGEQWIRLNKKFGEKEEIKIDVTMFDRSVPVKKSGGSSKDDEVYLHLTMIVDIFKGEGNGVLEFVCTAWPDSIEIHKVVMRGHGPIAAQHYTGPRFKELDDKLQDELYDFLETRGIDDDLAVFLHQYMKNKDKIEYVRWIAKITSILERK
nr:Mitochondrial acidic protein MAM33 [Ipomoea batatas]